MEQIGGRIAEIARNIEIVGADPVTLHGYTMVPNVILTKKELSVGAKLAYAMLLKYAWSDKGCYPGQLRLAGDPWGQGSVASVPTSRNLKELASSKSSSVVSERPTTTGSLSRSTSPVAAGVDRQNLPVRSGNDRRSRTADLAGLSIYKNTHLIILIYKNTQARMQFIK
jgi:hypothetical protein